ncbi:GPO family capsid scaffolding protein [Thiofilum flexile]|uniref:GPO family capsid scaffolding protein n=1 Tax=Thiofilum flexile TaxID=125627 RepID=UPI0003A49640|nr:GPO family capsid scaffolding protein [Thiofilum flexile]
MKLRTPFITACVAGKTADGREITEQQIDEMGSYNPTVYSAKIWLEHLRGTMPDGVFKSLGEVVAVKVVTLGSEAGILAGKKALKVQLEPHPDLVNMVRNGQKLHLSIEMVERLASTGKAYLVGIGVTDSPASLGTEIMQFNTSARKESLFSTPITSETVEFEVEHATSGTYGQSIVMLMSAVDQLERENATLKQQVQEKDKRIADLEDQVPAPPGYFTRKPSPTTPKQETNTVKNWF